MKVKEEGGKAGLKFNIQKAKIMASSSITSWQIGNWTPKSLQKETVAMKLKDASSLEEKL